MVSTVDLHHYITGNACDEIRGNYIAGSASVKLTEDSVLTAFVRGAIHCAAHKEAMRMLDQPTFGRHVEFVRMRDVMAAQADAARLDALAVGVNEKQSANKTTQSATNKTRGGGGGGALLGRPAAKNETEHLSNATSTTAYNETEGGLELAAAAKIKVRRCMLTSA